MANVIGNYKTSKVVSVELRNRTTTLTCGEYVDVIKEDVIHSKLFISSNRTGKCWVDVVFIDNLIKVY